MRCASRVVGHDSEAHRYVVVVRCSNLNRSCFLLAFNTIVRSESIEILQGEWSLGYRLGYRLESTSHDLTLGAAFNHVGEALVGEFNLMEQAACVLPAQVMLLNHIPPPQDAATAPSEEGADNVQQLVKRSVLLHQPSARAKTVCIRLRLRESHKADSKEKKSRGVKRLRDSKAEGSTNFRVFKYIERTHKGPSSHPRGVFEDVPASDEEGGASRRSESHAHLDTLVKSLKARLSSGVNELERLHGVTRDKRALCQRLDQLVMREWWETNSWKDGGEGALLSFIPRLPSSHPGKSRQDPILGPLESVIKAPGASTSSDADADSDSAEVRREADSAVSCAVTLSGFRLVQYMPSTSTLHIEVSLANNSSSVLLGAFVTMTLAPKSPEGSDPPASAASHPGRSTVRSSVVSAFHPASKTPERDGFEMFRVEMKLEHPPLQLLRGKQSALSGTVWLHWQASRDPRGRSMLNPPGIDRYQSLSRSPSSFAVASVSIPAEDLMAASCRPRVVSTATASQELLFLSTGSSLPTWIAQLQSSPSSSGVDSPCSLAPALVRPTFALANWSVGDGQAAVFALGRALSQLPRDVFVLRNPLQQRHLVDLLRCLHGLRREILSVQRRAIAPPLGELADALPIEGEPGDDSEEPAGRVSAFVRGHYRLQRETDLRIVGLLRELKLRADFHEAWVARGVKR